MNEHTVPNNASEAYEQTWRARRRDMAADAEAYGLATGSRSATVQVERVTYDADGRHVERIGSATWDRDRVAVNAAGGSWARSRIRPSGTP